MTGRATLLLLIACVSCTPVPAVELDGGKIILTPAERARLQVCAQQGGCHVVTVAQIAEIVREEIALALKAKTCGRDWL